MHSQPPPFASAIPCSRQSYSGWIRHNQSIGDINLRDAFFNPTLVSSVGIEVYLRGLAKQAHQTIDGYIVDDVRNFLFGAPGYGGFDLASLNMQRGRDHGLPRYNVVRQDFGLAPKSSFADVCSDPVMQAKLASCLCHRR